MGLTHAIDWINSHMCTHPLAHQMHCVLTVLKDSTGQCGKRSSKAKNAWFLQEDSRTDCKLHCEHNHSFVANVFCETRNINHCIASCITWKSCQKWVEMSARTLCCALASCVQALVAKKSAITMKSLNRSWCFKLQPCPSTWMIDASWRKLPVEGSTLQWLHLVLSSCWELVTSDPTTALQGGVQQPWKSANLGCLRPQVSFCAMDFKFILWWHWWRQVLEQVCMYYVYALGFLLIFFSFPVMN